MGRVRALTTLDSAYAGSRAINAHHGRTYYLATRLLPPSRRPAVHALYGFARVADEIVDNPGADPAGELLALESALKDAFDGGATGHPVLLALADTVRRWNIDRDLFGVFLNSMRMDLTVTDYANLDELAEYTHGSAGVIGLMLLPVLGTVSPEAAPYAAALGEAFQLTNFLRDVGEDLDRGRVYLPADHLAAFGVDRERLAWARVNGPDRTTRRAVAHFAAMAHAGYRAAEPGIALLDPVSRPCVATAARLYRAILDEIAAAGYDVLTRRAVVPAGRKASVVVPGVARCVLARLRGTQ
ncbi:phytoene/squalene synthase family protein [Actinokineospora cianjurensis]|uniref:Phytoene synthase n=1 Tax=Actinokineospora cianjurensis TaxID=585224 RepID=A0A421BAX6_9PSEU|nr:phytoene/squalene synthase family protein [Actinokineospora cianjurensis]RLK61507.1 phytoene synthase [Actinokineospora cianjurensis]